MAILFPLHPTPSSPLLHLYISLSPFISPKNISSPQLLVSLRPDSLYSSLPDSYSLSHSLFSNSLFSHYLFSQYPFSYYLSLTHNISHSISLSYHSLSVYSSLFSLYIYYIYLSLSHTLSLYHTTQPYTHSISPISHVPPN